MRNQFKHSLMDNNILRQDLNSIIKFLKKKILFLLNPNMLENLKKIGLNGWG